MSDKTAEITIPLSGIIDSNNAPEIEKKIFDDLSGQNPAGIVLDTEDLEYISSAGLRTILRLRKTYPSVKIINVRPGIYEILETTGFTQMMTVEKAFRRINVDDCEVIGRGATATIYRIDRENVVKVYDDSNALDEIIHEREMAKLALILGIPTAISYEIVKIGDRYGSVFELLDAVPFSRILASDPSRLEWCIEENVKLLNMLHSTHVSDGVLPDIRDKYISKLNNILDILPSKAADKALDLIRSVPYDDRMIHGDFHTKNILLLDEEVLLIDMETLSVGHPVFDLASMYDAYIGFSEPNREQVKIFQGFDFEISRTFWNNTLSAYLKTHDEKRLREVEDKARVPGYIRMMNFVKKHDDTQTEAEQEQLVFWKDLLVEVLERVDSLTF